MLPAPSRFPRSYLGARSRAPGRPCFRPSQGVPPGLSPARRQRQIARALSGREGVPRPPGRAAAGRPGRLAGTPHTPRPPTPAPTPPRARARASTTPRVS
eukprot:4548768-Pyramimonas_sp.AAC.1